MRGAGNILERKFRKKIPVTRTSSAIFDFRDSEGSFMFCYCGKPVSEPFFTYHPAMGDKKSGMTNTA